MNDEVKVKFLDEESAKLGLPFYRHDGDAGADLHVILDSNPRSRERELGKRIFPGERELLACGIALELPVGYWARIVHRSSTEKLHRLRVVEGTIDNGYRGALFVQVHNTNTFPVDIQHGDRLAQLIIHKIYQPKFVIVDSLTGSDRGEGGFGSTNK